MTDWMSIDQWQRCLDLARPGIIFEIRNAEGLSLFTPCVLPPPGTPFGWKSDGVEFRAVIEPTPEHSSPLPPPHG